MERWSGRVAVVTGASGGIGSAVCLALAEKGLNVVGLDIVAPTNPDPRIQYRHCDLLQVDQIESSFRWVEERAGGVDVLVNCAGYHTIGHITGKSRGVDVLVNCAGYHTIGHIITDISDKAVSDDEILKTMDLNIKAMIFCTRQAIASMKRRGVDDGYIVNINSVGGHCVFHTAVSNVYNSSKHAVTAFTGSLVNELTSAGSNIRVTSISPGVVRTPMTQRFVPEEAWTLKPHLLPQDVADTVLHVLSTPPRVHITEIVIQATKAPRT